MTTELHMRQGVEILKMFRNIMESGEPFKDSDTKLGWDVKAIMAAAKTIGTYMDQNVSELGKDPEMDAQMNILMGIELGLAMAEYNSVEEEDVD